ncbi:MAG: SDR family oxidoreductase, partial [Mariprofundaceae bacterium]|nr:SDR family oxidoreductase [Mariprofundaceae bacterium]
VISEDVCPANLHPYATSHRAGEDVVRAENEGGGIEGIVIRLSNAFGPPAHPGTNCWALLVNDLCRQAVTEHRMVLHSSGMQRRDFVTLHDVVTASRHLLETEGVEGVYNLGGSWAPSVFEMALLIQERCEPLLGYEPEIIRPLPASDETSPQFEYCIDRLAETGFRLGGRPELEIDGVLRLCRDYHAGTL